MPAVHWSTQYTLDGENAALEFDPCEGSKV